MHATGESQATVRPCPTKVDEVVTLAGMGAATLAQAPPDSVSTMGTVLFPLAPESVSAPADRQKAGVGQATSVRPPPRGDPLVAASAGSGALAPVHVPPEYVSISPKPRLDVS